MTNKYFVSCINTKQQLGAIQFEADENTFQQIAESLCPERAIFRAYIIKEFEKDIPIGEFVSATKMKELGY